MAPRIIDTIKQDHGELESYYNHMKSSDVDDQTRYQNQFTWELARHSIGKELVVYPAYEKHLSDGTAFADKDRQEHQSVKERLKKFQNIKTTDSSFLPTVNALMDELSQHIKEEETAGLVKLEEALTNDESESLFQSFGRTKMFIPSRSHPRAPSKPPYETAVGLLTASIDHLADLFRKWPETSTMPNPSTK